MGPVRRGASSQDECDGSVSVRWDVSTGQLSGGLALALAGLLLTSVALHATPRGRLDHEMTLVRLLGNRFDDRMNSRILSRLLLAGMTATAGLLLAPQTRFCGAALLLVWAVGFVWVNVRSVKMHISCGCFLNRRAAEWSDVFGAGLFLFYTLALLLTAASGISGGRENDAFMILVIAAGTLTTWYGLPLVCRKLLSARRYSGQVRKANDTPILLHAVGLAERTGRPVSQVVRAMMESNRRDAQGEYSGPTGH